MLWASALSRPGVSINRRPLYGASSGKRSQRWWSSPLPAAIAANDSYDEIFVCGKLCQRASRTCPSRSQHFFRNDQPIVITIVERPEKADEILPVIEGMMNGGIVAVTNVEVTVVSKGARTALP